MMTMHPKGRRNASDGTLGLCADVGFMLGGSYLLLVTVIGYYLVGAVCSGGGLRIFSAIWRTLLKKFRKS
jgi:hypothetical protein